MHRSDESDIQPQPIYEVFRIIGNIGKFVQALPVVDRSAERIGGHEAAQAGVVVAEPHVVETGLLVAFVAGVG
jgi:hypothetical protein